MTTIIGSIENGHYVARVPEYRMKVMVPLAPIGRRVGGVEIGAICSNLGTPQVSGRFWRRMKRGLKKAVKKTVRIAKKVANNKIVKKLYQTAKSLAPSPLNQILGAVETGVKFGKALAKGSAKAKAALPIVKDLAKGKITLARAKQLAPIAGVRAQTIRDAAATLKLKAKAKTNPKVAQMFRNVAEIEKAGGPKNERVITAKSGRKYTVQIRRAA